MNKNNFVMYVVYNNQVHLVDPEFKIIPFDQPFTFKLEDYDQVTKDLNNIHYVIGQVVSTNNIAMSDEDLKKQPYYNLISDAGIIDVTEQLNQCYIPLTNATGVDHIIGIDEAKDQIEKSLESFDAKVAKYTPIRNEHISLYTEVKKNKQSFEDVIANDQYQILLAYNTRRVITFNNYNLPYMAPIDGDLIYPITSLIEKHQEASKTVFNEQGQGLLFDTESYKR